MLKNIILASVIAVASITSSFAAMVNINKANAETIAENLKGVGLSKAKAIVKYRKDNGKFESVDELTNVKGIGEKTLEKNRDVMTVKAVKKDAAKSEE
ncbi:MAG: helix-hairpin-helix domain-containing protein [Thiotrichaceae bacterium]